MILIRSTNQKTWSRNQHENCTDPFTNKNPCVSKPWKTCLQKICATLKQFSTHVEDCPFKCNECDRIFYSINIGPKLKIQLNVMFVCLLFTFECKLWTLMQKIMRIINGENTQAVLIRKSGITQSIIIVNIMFGHTIWLIQILRSDRERISGEDNFLMNVIFHHNIRELWILTIEKAYYSEQMSLYCKSEIFNHNIFGSIY